MNTDILLDLEFSTQITAYQLYEQIEKPLFLLKDANVASKNFNDWRKAGLWYDETNEKRTWARLDLEQYIWLKMIQQMRQVGLSTELILKVKQELIVPLKFDELIKNLKKVLLIRAIEPNKKRELRNSFKSGKFIKEFKESAEGKALSKPQNKLRTFLSAALIERKHFAVLIFPNGFVMPWMDEILQYDPQMEYYLKSTHFYLSITEHLMEILTDPEKESFISPLKLLSEEENQVLSAVRDKTLKELVIIYPKDPKTRKASKHLITAQNGKLLEEDEERILDTLLHEKYQSMELKKRNGNKFYFEIQSSDD